MTTLQGIRNGRYRCRDVCATWNREDCDCEVYGSYHPAPSKCNIMVSNCIDEARQNMKRVGFRCPFCNNETVGDLMDSLNVRVKCLNCGKETLGVNYVYDKEADR